MMDLLKIEAEAGEHAERVLELIGERDGHALETYLKPLTHDQLRWALYSLGAAVIGQERANEDLDSRNRTLEAGNLQLFEDCKKLREDLESVREDRTRQAKLIGAQRATLKAAGLAR